MTEKMTERERTERRLIEMAYRNGRKDFAKEVIEKLEDCYLDDERAMAVQYNLGVGAAIREVRHFMEEV